jgi:hypothetical protein
MVHEARAGVDRPVAVMRDVYRDNRTAADGVAVFCSIEPGKTLTLNLLGSNNQSTPLMTLTLGLQENGNVIVRLPARGLK